MPILTTARADRSDNHQGTRCSSPRGLNSSGFTLLELSLVLLILVAVLGIVLPRLRDPGRAELLAQSHRLVIAFRWLRSEAVLNGSTYRLNYDLDQQRYWVDVADQSADLEQFARDTGPLARGTTLQPPVSMTDVVLPTLVGKIAQGQIYTVFYPTGEIDSTIIHLATPTEAYTLYVEPMSGRLKMVPGYRDVEYGGS
jgi:Tfp pilus assembly protein FimT